MKVLHEKTVGFCLSVFLTMIMSASASVFDDCLWSFRGPVDRDGDGVAKTGEIVDVIGGGQASAAVNQAEVYGNTHNAAGETADTGISSGITVRKETVSNFIRSFESPCLYFQNCVRESDSCVCPLGVSDTSRQFGGDGGLHRMRRSPFCRRCSHVLLEEIREIGLIAETAGCRDVRKGKRPVLEQ